MLKRSMLTIAIGILAFAAAILVAQNGAQNANHELGYTDTPMSLAPSLKKDRHQGDKL